MKSFGNGWEVQCRVIWALMLREIHTINGNSKLGYLWVLIQTAFGIAVFWGLRYFMGASAPHGMPMSQFLAAGFCLFSLISSGINKSFTAVSANKALLTFPQVTALDTLVSRLFVLSTTQFLTFVIIVFAGWLYGYPFKPSSYLLILAIWILAPLFSLGCGMIFCSIAAYLPAIEKIVPLVFRILFFISGIFFSASAFSPDIAKVLLWNPIFQFIELLREGLFVGYNENSLSLQYVVLVTLVVLCIGGFLEAFTRDRRVLA